jgi:hypothetical protein
MNVAGEAVDVGLVYGHASCAVRSDISCHCA